MKSKRQSSLLDFSATSHGQVWAPSPDSIIECPVCRSSVLALSIEDRILHVEQCLTLLLINEPSKRRKTEPEPAPETGTLEVPILVDETVEVVQEIQIATRTVSRGKSAAKRNRIKKDPQPAPATPAKKKELSAAQKDKLRYINRPPIKHRTVSPDTAEPSSLPYDLKLDEEIFGEAPPQPELFVKSESQPELFVKSESPPEAALPGDAPPDLLPCSRKTEIPLVKILTFPVQPGLVYSVSVDAFQYKPHLEIDQYFLSHFHSDHYGGISKRWCRERVVAGKIIFCSEITQKLLAIRFKVDPDFVFAMRNDTRYCIRSHCGETHPAVSQSRSPGLYCTPMDANHCPGANIFLFEGIPFQGPPVYTLHCGDFRVCESMLAHPLMAPFRTGGGKQLANVYLDTTYMSPEHNFPKQEQVCDAAAELVARLIDDDTFARACFGNTLQSRITDFLSLKSTSSNILVLVGTYLIGKERLAMAVSKRLGGAPIYVASALSRGDKEEIIRSYGDEFLDSVLVSGATDTRGSKVMIHLVPMKIAGNAAEMQRYVDYNNYHNDFGRCVGFRPTGWSFREKAPAADDDSTLLERPQYSVSDILQNNAVKAGPHRIFSLPYSEHSSYRELFFFVVLLNIRRVIPTVNMHHNERMAAVFERWSTVRELGLGTGRVSLEHF